MTDQATFRRQLRTITAHFRRHPYRPAPTTRNLEFAFETNQAHSDAMAACLMRDPAIRSGLDQWGVFSQEVWLASARRHDGKTVEQIILETYPGEGGR